MVVSVEELITMLEGAQIEPTTENISALQGMLSLEVFPPDQCLLDLKSYNELGATWI